MTGSPGRPHLAILRPGKPARTSTNSCAQRPGFSGRVMRKIPLTGVEGLLSGWSDHLFSGEGEKDSTFRESQRELRLPEREPTPPPPGSFLPLHRIRNYGGLPCPPKGKVPRHGKPGLLLPEGKALSLGRETPALRPLSLQKLCSPCIHLPVTFIGREPRSVSSAIEHRSEPLVWFDDRIVDGDCRPVCEMDHTSSSNGAKLSTDPTAATIPESVSPTLAVRPSLQLPRFLPADFFSLDTPPVAYVTIRNTMGCSSQPGHDPAGLGELERGILSIVWRKGALTAEHVRIPYTQN